MGWTLHHRSYQPATGTATEIPRVRIANHRVALAKGRVCRCRAAATVVTAGEFGKDGRPVPANPFHPTPANPAVVSVRSTPPAVSSFRRGLVPLWVVLILAAGLLVVLGWWTYFETSGRTADGRQEIVAWGITFFGEDVYALVHEFEKRNPRYKVIISSSAERDSNSDSQRLLSAIAGGVPPDVVFFARHTTGEWASRNALLDLTPMIEAQDPNDPARINLDEYYDWAVAEASYAPALPPSPGTPGEARGEGSSASAINSQSQQNPHPNPSTHR